MVDNERIRNLTISVQLNVKGETIVCTPPSVYGNLGTVYSV